MKVEKSSLLTYNGYILKMKTVMHYLWFISNHISQNLGWFSNIVGGDSVTTYLKSFYTIGSY